MFPEKNLFIMLQDKITLFGVLIPIFSGDVKYFVLYGGYYLAYNDRVQ